MNCETVERGNVVERYVLGQLNEAEQASFEDHYFACDSCFEQVRLMQGLQAAGEGRPRPAVVLEMPRRNWMIWGAVAAVVVAGFLLTEISRTRQPAAVPVAKSPAPSELQLLARVDPPRYTATNLRSSASDRDEKFRAAMTKYAAGDYAAAANDLRGVDTAAARFYLSIADLMTGVVEEPVTMLRSIDEMGETPYLEQARFFLAKALLANHDIAGATKALEQTIALKGDRETEARELLERVHKLP